jgi:hypothetical protein
MVQEVEKYQRERGNSRRELLLPHPLQNNNEEKEKEKEKEKGKGKEKERNDSLPNTRPKSDSDTRSRDKEDNPSKELKALLKIVFRTIYGYGDTKRTQYLMLKLFQFYMMVFSLLCTSPSLPSLLPSLPPSLSPPSPSHSDLYSCCAKNWRTRRNRPPSYY